MIRPVVRLLMISAIAILWGGMTLFVLRYLGLQQEFTAFDHPLLKQQSLVIAAGGSGAKHAPYTLAAFQDAYSVSAKVWLEARLWLTADNHWVIHPDARTDENQPLRQMKLHDLRPGVPGNSPLYSDTGAYPTPEELFLLLPQAVFVLDVQDFSPVALDQLMALIDQHGLEDRVVITSPRPQPIAYIKDKKPRWLYTSDPTNTMKARVFSALNMTSVMSLRPDLVISPLKVTAVGAVTEDMAKELHRRQIKLVLLASSWPEFLSSPLAQYASGILTDRPTKDLLAQVQKHTEQLGQADTVK